MNQIYAVVVAPNLLPAPVAPPPLVSHLTLSGRASPKSPEPKIIRVLASLADHAHRLHEAETGLSACRLSKPVALWNSGVRAEVDAVIGAVVQVVDTLNVRADVVQELKSNYFTHDSASIFAVKKSPVVANSCVGA